MKLLTLCLLCLMFAGAGLLHAEDGDSDMVHGLAHGAAGAIVAMAVDVGPINMARLGCKTENRHIAWYYPVLLETAAALLVDEMYELDTNKTPAVLAQHNLDAALGGALYSTRLSFQF